MATLYGSASNKRLNLNPVQQASTQEQHGRMRVAYDTYTSVGNLAIGDVIQIGSLPSGARVVGGWLAWTAMTAGAADWGNQAGATGLEAATVASFAPNASVALGSAGFLKLERATPSVGLGKLFKEAVEVVLTLSTATTAVGTIQSCIWYVVD